jgi:hypothetical protein
MPVDGVHQHGHEGRRGIEAGTALAECIQRFGLRVEPLHGRKVGPNRLVHGTDAGRAFVGEKGLEGLVLYGVARGLERLFPPVDHPIAFEHGLDNDADPDEAMHEETRDQR